MEYLCESIMNLGQWLWKRLWFKGYSTFCTGGYFVPLSRPICAIMVEDIARNISVKLF